MPDSIVRFSGRYRFLSNFYPSPIVWAGILFPTVEHAFHAGKTFDESTRLRIAAAPSPAEAKKLGGPPHRGGIVHTLCRDWDFRVRYEVMTQLLELKFADVPLRRLLLDTDDAELVEGNNWHDTHWGACYCPRHVGAGANHLGRLLTELRAQLRHQAGTSGVHR